MSHLAYGTSENGEKGLSQSFGDPGKYPCCCFSPTVQKLKKM